MFSVSVPIAKYQHDTAYLGGTLLREGLQLGDSEGGAGNVRRSGGFGILIVLTSSGRRLLRRDWRIQNAVKRRAVGRAEAACKLR